jgi:hypothetical protein
MFMPRRQITGQKHNTKICITSLENMSDLGVLKRSNINYISEEENTITFEDYC